MMQCLPLYTILLALGNPAVHHFSLDIEGAELPVLKTVPWDKVDIRFIIDKNVLLKKKHKTSHELRMLLHCPASLFMSGHYDCNVLRFSIVRNVNNFTTFLGLPFEGVK